MAFTLFAVNQMNDHKNDICALGLPPITVDLV
jgi:hypothetical protein